MRFTFTRFAWTWFCWIKSIGQGLGYAGSTLYFPIHLTPHADRRSFPLDFSCLIKRLSNYNADPTCDPVGWYEGETKLRFSTESCWLASWTLEKSRENLASHYPVNYSMESKNNNNASFSVFMWLKDNHVLEEVFGQSVNARKSQKNHNHFARVQSGSWPKYCLCLTMIRSPCIHLTPITLENSSHSSSSSFNTLCTTIVCVLSLCNWGHKRTFLVKSRTPQKVKNDTVVCATR